MPLQVYEVNINLNLALYINLQMLMQNLRFIPGVSVTLPAHQ